MSAELTSYEDCMNELNKLKDLIHSLKTNCEYKGKDQTGAVVYGFELGYDASQAFARAHSHIKAIESFLKEHIDENRKSSTINLLDWLSENPNTADRLSSVKTPEGIELAIRNAPVIEQVGYTIEQLEKEWAAYIFVLNGNCDGPRNEDEEPLGFRSFVEFLQIPHEVLYVDGGIYTVRFNCKKE